MMKRIISFILAVSIVFVFGTTAFASSCCLECSHILNTLSLKEKVGQMIMPAFRYWEKTEVTEINDSIADAISSLGLGGVILFSENTQGTEQTARLISDMQSAALKSDSGIPLFMAVDQEGGYIYRLGTGTSLCGNMALGATGDTDNANLAAKIIGSELSALGFNVDFAPDMDVNSNPSNPVIGVRSFSDNANVVAKFGVAFINGLNSRNIISSLKHFPGHGDTETDSHTGLPCINKSLKEIEKQELIPFKAGIEAGADMIMTAHIQFPEIEKKTYTSRTGEEVYLPATLSRTMITDVLRRKLGFRGVVCSDSMLMDAVSKTFNSLDAAKLAINAGVDILLMPVNITCDNDIKELENYIDKIVGLVEAGDISEKTIDKAVMRILKLKEKRGILDLKINEEAQVKKALSIVGSKFHHDLEWKITEEAITLVKNNCVLPIRLNEDETVALFASYSNEVTEAEFAAEKLAKAGYISSQDRIKVYSYTKKPELNEEQKQAVLDSKAVIISVESAKNWELTFANNLIEYAHSNGKKVVLISIQLPYDLASYKDADALIAAYNCKGMNVKPNEYIGETKSYGPNMAVAITACFGAFKVQGKLPVSIPGLANRGFGLTCFMAFPKKICLQSML